MLQEVTTQDRLQIKDKTDLNEGDEKILADAVVDALNRGERWEIIVRELKKVGIDLEAYDPNDQTNRSQI